MKRKPSSTSGITRLRCAIYTRKSSEEGLEQNFNSLDAQREACEAYILSQAGEGWQLVPTAYDDGGFSGGNMERPGLVRLLADVDAGKVDVILVYKVDRLTRSLMDFARIVERLDARNISFVSVTQAFSTTSSMGRLTLNVLLSFAQFEREVTGERIRDKIAASKAKGIWMGGGVPLGYDLGDRRLIVNDQEAATVRHIYTRYLELKSVPALAKELQASGITSKRRTSRSGREIGGLPFRLGALYHVLQNSLYLGEVVHRDLVHEGEHDAIISRELFDAVQALLTENRSQRRDHPTRAAGCPLTGIIVDAEAVPMSPSFGYGRASRYYRYYVSASVLPGRGPVPQRRDIIRRVPAPALEALVLNKASMLLDCNETIEWAELRSILNRVEIREASVHLLFDGSTMLDPHESAVAATGRLAQRTAIGDQLAIDADGLLRLICDGRPVFRGGRIWRRDADEPSNDKRGSEPALIMLLKAAHAMLARYKASPLDLSIHHDAEAPVGQRDRRLMAVGMLAPDIQRAILERRAPARLTAKHLLGGDLPIAWEEQRKLLGFET
ncbi:MAG: recombinase family protein [Sphingomonadaceae bacterium]